MKQTIFISLDFYNDGTGVQTTPATAKISIPFKVKKLHVKSLAYQPSSVTADYVVIRSNIDTKNSPLGILYRDSTYGSATVNDVEIAFEDPQVIQGVYNFNIYRVNTNPTTNPYGELATITGSGNDYIGLIIEFNSPEEIF
jgi:hypothetical protein